MSPYAFLDHDAEMGLTITAATREALYAEAAKGLAACLTDPSCIPLLETRFLSIEAAHPGELLVRWLAEWLYLYETAGFLPGAVTVTEATDTRVAGEARGGTPGGTALREIKAVTRHQAAVERTADGWTARVIFDV